MVQHMSDAVAGFRRDWEKFSGQLSAFEARGLAASPYAEIVRDWIRKLDDLIFATR
jgi:hypothetical protein